jgi:hypothetical protein
MTSASPPWSVQKLEKGWADPVPTTEWGACRVQRSSSGVLSGSEMRVRDGGRLSVPGGGVCGSQPRRGSRVDTQNEGVPAAAS